ncbi:hypothetical protein PS659_06010 [Pseudomonas fluorescens]|uniref:Uncharacterized protein n=1 Tax=Pseudomonas fluorescens TaxID=294 RepID=A0A5E6Y4C4_PSEFL|nr:hypothetical protein PS659_06010 [Pseudomonas fluorescens]
MGQSDTGHGLGLGLIQQVQQIRRERRRQLRLAFDFPGIEGQLQYAAVVPVTAPLQVFEQASGVAEAADDHLRQRRAVCRKFQVEHALRVARSFPGDVVVTLQQCHLPAPCGKAGGAGTTGQAGTDHQCPAFAGQRGRAGKPRLFGERSRGLFGPAEELAAQDFPFMADARGAFHLEAGSVEQASHPSGAGKGADGRTGSGQASQFGKQFGGPHVRVFRRSETVEEPGVDPGVELRQLLQCIANQEGQGHTAVVQRQALETLMNRHVLLKQLIGKHLEFRPQPQGTLQIGRAQRVLFDADKMQPSSRCRVLLEHLPGTEEIQSGAKPRFADDQPPALGQGGKTFGQAVLLDKDITGFVQPRLVGEIHIVEHSRIRTTLVIPVELGVGQYRFHGRLGNGKGAILADRGCGQSLCGEGACPRWVAKRP